MDDVRTEQQRGAGRELDAEIAERVFGQTVEQVAVCYEATWDHEGPWRPVPPSYSSRIEDAFQVVEAMRAKGYGVLLHAVATGTWDATVTRFDRAIVAAQHSRSDTSLPLAICLAALAALDADKGEITLELIVDQSAPLSGEDSNG